MSYPVVRNHISEAELQKLGFESENWTDEGVSHVFFRRKKGELIIDVSGPTTMKGTKKVFVEQVVSLQINEEWVYIDIADLAELKTLTQILFKE